MRDMLMNPNVKQQFENALGEAAAPFIASVMEIYSGDSTLVTCDPKQVISESLKAAILKLPVIRSLGFSWIVPYRKKGVAIPQFQIGYRGYIQLATRTGYYKTINADKVYEGELQNLDKLTGEIAFEGQKKSDKVVGYFAHFVLLNGFSKTLYMTKEQVDAHAKKYSRTYGSEDSIWVKEYDGMAIKTVLRNLLSHYGYLSIEMMNAITTDEDYTPEAQRDEAQKSDKKIVVAEDVKYDDVTGSTPEQPEAIPDYAK
jgi:recombination protein RecT